MKIVIAILAALLVFLILKAIAWGLKRLLDHYPGFRFNNNQFIVVELIVWIIFIFWSSDYLFLNKYYYHYLVYSLVFIVTGFLAWYLIRDIFAGIIFRLKHNLKAGMHIRAGDLSGRIKSQHLTFLKIKTADGQILRIPYPRINQEIISELTYTDALREHVLHIRVDSSLSMMDATNLIRTTILNAPWSNLNEEPLIKFLKENENGCVFEVMIYSMNANHLKFIEMAIDEVPSVKILKKE